ncbi:phage tail protein, partial [Staphylococcus aureus]|nr:phage tail protein [Staphylococcus aureus]
KKKNSLFKGKEIEYGKDLVGLTRKIDMSEIKTALIVVGPENDKGKRLELVVTDDEAQSQFNLPTRYIWGIYEPQSDDQNMNETRLRSLAKTELNKRKSAVMSYEITSTDLE